MSSSLRRRMVQMKKIIGLIVIGLLGFVGYKGYEYYQSTYVGETAYAVVPAEVPTKVRHESKSGIGDQSPWYSYDYQLTFVKEDASIETQVVSLSDEDAKPLPPNSYVKATISEKRVLTAPKAVQQDSIPDYILNKLTNQK